MTRNTLLALDSFLPYRLSVVSNLVSAAIAAHYAARFSLSIPEWRVMAVLAAQPGLSAAEVAARTAMDKVAVSRAVASLLRSRRLERRVAAGDRRRSVLQLSRAGLAVYEQVVPVALQYEQTLLQSLSATERRQLDHLLTQLQRRAIDLAATLAAAPRGRRSL
jgi:DNA-binding MarR family transcriptional regulator